MEKNTSYKALCCIFLMLAMVLIPSVSALEWDNVKSYDATTREVTIHNSFLQLFKTGEVAKVRLDTPLNVRVGAGYQQVAQMTFNSYSDYSNAIKTFELYDMNNGMKPIDRKIDLKYKTIESVEVDDFKTICETITDKNLTKSEVCTQEKVGTHFEKQVVWKDLNSMDLKTGGITIGIFTEVKVGDYIDWIPTIYGVKVEEWATWEESLEVGLISYYDFEESSGNLLDYMDNYDLYVISAEREKAGIINKAYNFSYTGGFAINGTSFDKDDYNTGLTSNVWIWIDTAPSTFAPIWYKAESGWGSWALMVKPDLSLYTQFGTGSSAGKHEGMITFNTSQWYMITQLHTTSYDRVYVNGVKVGDFGTATLVNGLSGINIGANNDGSWTHKGKIDEMGHWGRELSEAEITNLYNSESGISPTQTTDASPNITLNSPTTSANYTTLQSFTFNFTASDDIALSDVKLYVNDVLNQTNATGINNSVYLFPLDLTDGDYTIKGIATDNASQTTNSSSVRFVINTTPFIQFVAPTYANATNITGDAIPVNVSLTETYFENVTFNFYKGDVLNESITFTDSTRFYNKTGCACDTWKVNVTTCTTTNQCNSTETRVYFIDVLPPVLTTTNNLTDIITQTLPINSTWSFNATDPHIDKCYYNSTDHAKIIVTCNSTITSTAWATGGVKSLTYCANDTFGNENCTTTSLNVYDFVVTQSGASAVGEGGDVTFGLNVTSTSFAIGDASANLWWNGTNKGTTTKTVASANTIRFLTTFNVPDGTGNTTGYPVNWNWIWNATNYATTNTSAQSQKVYAVSITDCGVTSGYVILNLSLKDEETNTLVNVTSPNLANIEIDLTATSLDNTSLTWGFSKQWTNNSHAVCVPDGLLNNTEYSVEFIIGYDSTDRVREFYYMDNGTLDINSYFNSYTSKNVSLMDLLSEDSTTFLFEYTDENNQKVDDIIVHTFRNYIGEGEYREVERSKQDNAGQTHVHLVEEDVIYYFMITQYGEILFTSDTYNAKCLSTPCEISLSASATETNWSIIDNEGGQYVVTSDQSTRTVTTTFSLDTISLVNASLYKMTNLSGVPELVNSSSLTATSGSIDFTIPLSYENTTYFVSVYKDNEFVKSSWVSMTESGKDYFGTFGALLGGFIVLAMMLMAVTEGAGFIVVTIIALVIIGVMQLVDLGWMAIISIICAGGIIIWKLINRRGTRQ